MIRKEIVRQAEAADSLGLTVSWARITWCAESGMARLDLTLIRNPFDIPASVDPAEPGVSMSGGEVAIDQATDLSGPWSWNVLEEHVLYAAWATGAPDVTRTERHHEVAWLFHPGQHSGLEHRPPWSMPAFPLRGPGTRLEMYFEC